MISYGYIHSLSLAQAWTLSGKWTSFTHAARCWIILVAILSFDCGNGDSRLSISGHPYAKSLIPLARSPGSEKAHLSYAGKKAWITGADDDDMGNKSNVYKLLETLPSPVQHGLVYPLPPGTTTTTDLSTVYSFYYMLRMPSMSVIVEKTKYRDQYEALICLGVSSESSFVDTAGGDKIQSGPPIILRMLDISSEDSQTWRSTGYLDFSAVNSTCMERPNDDFLPALAVSPLRLSVFIFGFGPHNECAEIFSWSSSRGLQHIDARGGQAVPHVYHTMTTQEIIGTGGGSFRLISFGGRFCPNANIDDGTCNSLPQGTNELWHLTFGNESPVIKTWEKMVVDGSKEVPVARFSADLYALNSSTLIMYGGFSHSSGETVYLCDLWQFDTNLRQWTLLTNLSADCEMRSRCPQVPKVGVDLKQLTTYVNESQSLLVLVSLCGSTEYTVYRYDLTDVQPLWQTLPKSSLIGDSSFQLFYSPAPLELSTKLSLVSARASPYLVEWDGFSTHRLIFDQTNADINTPPGSAALLLLNNAKSDGFVGNWGCVPPSPVQLPMEPYETVKDYSFDEYVTIHSYMLGGMCGGGSSISKFVQEAPMPVWTMAVIGEIDMPKKTAYYTKNIVTPSPPFGQRIGHSTTLLSQRDTAVIVVFGGGHAQSVYSSSFELVPSDIWCFDIRKFHWVQSPIRGVRGRMFHVAFAISNTSLIVYGGSDQQDGELHAINDVSLLEFSDLSLCKGNMVDLTPSVQPQPLPTLFGHASVVFRGMNLIYGGETDGPNCCSSNLLFSVTIIENSTGWEVSWQNLSFQSPPLGRHYHSLSVYNEDSLLVIGNRSRPDERDAYYSTAMLLKFNHSDVFAEGEVTYEPFFNDHVTYHMQKFGAYLLGGFTTFDNPKRGDPGERTFVYGSQYSLLDFEMCPVGRQYNATHSLCEKCPLNYYSATLNLPCEPCLENAFTNYTGTFNRSDCYIPNPCQPDTCNGHGQCDSPHGQAVCTCDVGYMKETMCYLPIYYMIAGTVFLLAVVIILSICRKYRSIRLEAREKHRQLKASKKKITELTDVWEIQWQQLTMRHRIAAGGFGEVWLAELSDMLVAVKKLRQHSLSDPVSIRDFQRESELMRTVRHPNVVLFIGAGTTPSAEMFLVLEFLKRGSLSSQLRDLSVPLDYGERLRFAQDAAKGMAFLHGLSPPRIHRDLKSSNLLVSDKWVVKVADFGTSRLIEKLETPQPVAVEMAPPTSDTSISVQERTPLLTGSDPLSGFVGTHLWQSPEMMQRRDYGASTDVYR